MCNLVCRIAPLPSPPTHSFSEEMNECLWGLNESPKPQMIPCRFPPYPYGLLLNHIRNFHPFFYFLFIFLSTSSPLRFYFFGSDLLIMPKSLLFLLVSTSRRTIHLIEVQDQRPNLKKKLCLLSEKKKTVVFGPRKRKEKSKKQKQADVGFLSLMNFKPPSSAT